MKVLVTGANGFLGAALVERLLVHGIERPCCLVRAGSDRSRLDDVQSRHPEQSIELVEGSLATVDAAAKLFDGVDLVFHLAATMSGAAADMFLGTVVASDHLLRALPRETRVVLVSSFGVYGPAGLPRGSVIDESTPLEPHPERRDIYSQAKRRQERLFSEHAERHGTALTILRPGVIYGPGGGAMSGRVGLQLPALFLHLGGDNVLPAAYQREVKKLRSLRVPFPLLMLGSHLVERYHTYSHGQLPAIFTPYKTNTTWKGHRFSNAKLEALGWRQIVSTEEGLRRTFAYLRSLSGGAPVL